MTRTATSAIVVTGIANVAAALGAFLVGMLLTRLLSPEDVGVYYFLLSVAWFMSLLCIGGLNHGVMKHVAISAHTSVAECAERLRAGLILLAIRFPLVACAYLVVEFLLGFPHGFGLPIVAVGWALTIALQAYGSAVLRGLSMDLHASWVAGALATILNVAALGVMLESGIQIGVESALVTSWVATGLVGVLAVAWLVVSYRGKWSFQLRSALLRDSSEMFPVGLGLFVIANCDLWLVQAWASEPELGFYSIASRVAIGLVLPMSAVNIVTAPRIALAWAQRDFVRLQALALTSSRLSLACAGLGIIGLIFYGEWILETLFGAQYSVAYRILLILACGHVIQSSVGAAGYFLLMTGNQRAMIISLAGGATALVLVSATLIRSYGAEGIAFAFLAASAVHAFAMGAFVLRRVGINPFPIGATHVPRVVSGGGG